MLTKSIQEIINGELNYPVQQRETKKFT